MPGSKRYDRQRVFEHTYMLKLPGQFDMRFDVFFATYVLSLAEKASYTEGFLK